MTEIWNSAATTPAATHRVPVDRSSSSSSAHWTGQQIADVRAYIGETVNSLGSISTNQSLSLVDGRYIAATIAGNVQFTFTSVPAGATEIFLELTDGGAHTVSFAASLTWTGGTVPSLPTSGVALLHLRTRDGGTTYLANMVSDEQSFDAAAVTSGVFAAARLPAATTSAQGAVELAIASEVDTGTDATRAMTPDSYRDSTPYYTDRAADWTLAQADGNTEQQFNSASALVCTIDTNANVAISTGTIVPMVRIGAGSATIDAVAGVTINGVDGASKVISTRYQGALLRKVGTNAWILSGDIA